MKYNELITTVRSASGLSAELLEKYEAFLKSTANYNESQSVNEAFDGVLSNFKKQDFSQDELLQLSKLAAIEQMVLNSYSNLERSRNTPKPKDRFKAALKEILDGKSGEEKTHAIARIRAIKEKMILSIVHTMHPVVFYTPESKHFESQITHALEGNKERDCIEAIKDFTKKAISGKVEITPLTKITTETENAIEKANYDNIRSYYGELTKAWNEAITELKLPDDLKIDNYKDIFESRTWGNGADADGREKSDAIQLYKYLHDNAVVRTENGQSKIDGFKAPIPDLRQNAKVHEELVSALIQRRYGDSVKILKKTDGTPAKKSAELSAFSGICENFVKGLNKKLETWKNPSKSIYQQLGADENKANFLKEILSTPSQGKSAFVPGEVKSYTTEFNRIFKEQFAKILEEKGLDPKTKFEDLKYYESKEDGVPTLQDEFINLIRDQVININVGGKSRKVSFDYNDDTFQPMENIIGKNLLKNGKKLDSSGNVVMMSKEDRVVCMEVVKRLFVMADAIDTGIIKPQTKDGKEFYPIRHQIANFSGASNFYEMLLLFRETGLVEIENGKVSKVKMGIQPLLETEEDLKNAPKIFRQLLDDPLALSYYKKRGVAEIMVGFSDGAKSAGNFASQFAIYTATKELSKLFADKEIPLRVFEGRGRGPDRGGTIEAGIASHLLPAEVAKTCVADRTYQGDLPGDMANSPAYGKDQITSTMIGIIQAAEAANTMTDGDEKRIESYEKAAAKIAEKSSEIFNKLVAQNNDAFIFMQSMPTNGNKSSRNATRKKNASYESTRAVPVEEAANLADFPFHNIGLAEALEEFKKNDNGITVLTKDGKNVSGKDALKEMAENWPFFREFFRVDYLGMNHFDANIAQKYAVMAKVGDSEFVKSGIASLTSLSTQLQELVPEADKNTVRNYKKSPIQQALEGLDKFGHSVLFSLFPSGFLGYEAAQNKLLDEVKNLAMFVCYGEVSRKAPEIGLLPQSAALGNLERHNQEVER